LLLQRSWFLELDPSLGLSSVFVGWENDDETLPAKKLLGYVDLLRGAVATQKV
jgi:hypothetical protein